MHLIIHKQFYSIAHLEGATMSIWNEKMAYKKIYL